MVKIESKEKTEEIRKREELEEITKKTLPDIPLFKASSEHMFVFSLEKNIRHLYYVNAKEDSISISSKECFDIAIYLAKEYEKFTGTEWTLKKEYYD